jgi:hypothetical protein
MPAYSRKIAFFTAAVFVVAPLHARAGMAQAPTVGALMSKACPAANELGKEQERAQALADDSRFALAKKTAALYYDCYQQLSDAYTRDWAHFQYLIYLSNSPPTTDNDKTIQVLTIVGDGANQLAGSTQFTDVRKAALWLRDNVRNQVTHLELTPQ